MNAALVDSISPLRWISIVSQCIQEHKYTIFACDGE